MFVLSLLVRGMDPRRKRQRSPYRRYYLAGGGVLLLLVAYWSNMFQSPKKKKPRLRPPPGAEGQEVGRASAVIQSEVGRLCTISSMGNLVNGSDMDTRVQRGMLKAQSLRIVFAGLVHRKRPGRSHSLALDLDKFIELGGIYFSDYRVVLYESNSHADTKMQLREACSPSGSKVVCLSGDASSTKVAFGDKSASRLFGMASMRNIYLEYVLGHSELSTFDVLAVADLDLHDITDHFLPFRMKGGEKNHTYNRASLADGWNVLAAVSAFGISATEFPREDSPPRADGRLPWSVLCANGLVEGTGRHYDSFAFKPFDMGESKQWVFKGLAPVKVDSCFGGLAFYSLRGLALSGCTYVGADGLCEHAGLHQCLARSPPHSGSFGGTYLYPFLANQMDRETRRVCGPKRGDWM